jgi:hypothetical protein
MKLLRITFASLTILLSILPIYAYMQKDISAIMQNNTHQTTARGLG